MTGPPPPAPPPVAWFVDWGGACLPRADRAGDWAEPGMAGYYADEREALRVAIALSEEAAARLRADTARYRRRLRTLQRGGPPAPAGERR